MKVENEIINYVEQYCNQKRSINVMCSASIYDENNAIIISWTTKIITQLMKLIMNDSSRKINVY